MKTCIPVIVRRTMLVLLCAVLFLPSVPVAALEEITTDHVSTPPAAPDTEKQEEVSQTPVEATPVQEAVPLNLPVSEPSGYNNVSAPSALAENEPPIVPPGVVVSRVVTGMPDASNQELIELYNNTAEDSDITGWCVNYYSSSLTERSHCFQAPGVGYHLFLPAKAHVVLASNAWLSAYPSFSSDGIIASNSLAENRGKVVIYASDSTYIDGVAWSDGKSGSAIDSIEGSSAVAPARGQELAREFTAESYRDTNNNQLDFLSGPIRQTYTTGAVVEVLDYCTNLPDIQYELPSGQQRDEADGTCSDIPDEPSVPDVTCEGVVLSEIAANTSLQFVELHNPTDEVISLEGCMLKTNRNDEAHVFTEIELQPDAYHSVTVRDTRLLLTKTTTGTVYLLSSDGQKEYDVVEYANLKSNTSWAQIDGAWKQTYMPTPEAENVYMEAAPCSDGYIRNELTGRCNKQATPGMGGSAVDCGEGRERNPETGRCRNIPTENTLTPCRADQERNPETNRCRSIVTAASTLVPCKEGQERNPATNRCRSIASAVAELIPCDEGYERNPATNRCRKVQASEIPAAAFPVEPVKDAASAMFAWWAVGGVLLAGAGWGVWEWRHEIRGGVRKLFTRGRVE